MSMGTHVIGFRPPDERHQQMRSIWEACESVGIEQPDEVIEYFDGMPPDDAGVEIEIEHTTWEKDMRAGIDVDVRKLPKDCHIIRFVNTW